VSSADTARDLNVLRQDVGDPRLTYLGLSYGTVIGATYASLFPDKVQAMVLDGTLDFTGNATGHHPGEAAASPWTSEAAVRELGNARLLKVNGDGHTSMYVEPSTCRDDAELAYLVSLRLPPKGAACDVDQLPFGLTP